MPGGWIYWHTKVKRWQTGVEVRWCSLCSRPWSLCRVPVLVLYGGYPVTRCYLERWERESLAAVFLEVELNSGEICRVYKAAGWWAAAGADQPVTRKCRCSASVSRATLMRYRDARHNIYTVHIHILCKQKLLFWMRLITINNLTALFCSYFKNKLSLLKLIVSWIGAISVMLLPM